MMLEKIEAAAPDPIFGLNRQFCEDPRADKINLSVGVYLDEQGTTPSLNCVREAEQRLLQRPIDRQYLSIDGLSEYNRAIGEVLLGAGHSALDSHRLVTVQSVGGTSALRIFADTIAREMGSKSVWVSDPTWGNHHQIFGGAGHQLCTYGWIDAARTGLDFDQLTQDLAAAQPGDILLLHACCHNPTGVDPSPEQWDQILQLVSDRRLLPVFDFAYQGFGESLDGDAQVIRQFCDRLDEVVICNSFSKNFSLYNERVGGLSVCCRDRSTAETLLTQIKKSIRSDFSNPPFHGASVVAEILGDAELRKQWEQELKAMRERIFSVRRQFCELMSQLLPQTNFEFVKRQKGMFSFSGLDASQVARLRDEFGIYLIGNGRINLAGISSSNIEQVCQAIAACDKTSST